LPAAWRTRSAWPARTPSSPTIARSAWSVCSPSADGPTRTAASATGGRGGSASPTVSLRNLSACGGSVSRWAASPQPTSASPEHLTRQALIRSRRREPRSIVSLAARAHHVAAEARKDAVERLVQLDRHLRFRPRSREPHLGLGRLQNVRKGGVLDPLLPTSDASALFEEHHVEVGTHDFALRVLITSVKESPSTSSTRSTRGHQRGRW